MFCQNPGEVAGATPDVTRGPYPIGTVIRYRCIVGVGGTITCQTNGQWTQKPTCTGAGTGMNCNFFMERYFIDLETSNSRIVWDMNWQHWHEKLYMSEQKQSARKFYIQ